MKIRITDTAMVAVEELLPGRDAEGDALWERILKSSTLDLNDAERARLARAIDGEEERYLECGDYGIGRAVESLSAKLTA
jgi:hypothetical protein